MKWRGTNDFVDRGDYIELILTDRKGEESGRTLISKESFDRAKDVRWCKRVNRGKYYAVGYLHNFDTGTGRLLRLHRYLLEAPEDMDVDHIDGDGLNNQLSNLRVCTHQQNLWNNRKYKGVRSRYGRWQARIVHNGIEINLGMYDTEKEAIQARVEAEVSLRGEYAPANKEAA